VNDETDLFVGAGEQGAAGTREGAVPCEGGAMGGDADWGVHAALPGGMGAERWGSGSGGGEEAEACADGHAGGGDAAAGVGGIATF
jgi:hypothetical protein